MLLLGGTNAETDFGDCVVNAQKTKMKQLLKPIDTATANLAKVGDTITENVSDSVIMINNVRDSISQSTTQLFTIFGNVSAEYEKLTENVKDNLSRVVTMFGTMIYILDGSSKTVQSAWNGPNGTVARSGHCFHPNTLIEIVLGDNKIILKKIKNVQLGDVLVGGSIVQATMKVDIYDPDTGEEEQLYSLKRVTQSPSHKNILVTGSHYIVKENKFIRVQDYPDATLSAKKTNYYSCLITNNHLIHIGGIFFADWEGKPYIPP